MRQLPLDLHQRPPATLDNFVAGANDEVLALARALLGGARTHRFIYLWGPAGAGKTHLLRALAPGARWLDANAIADEVAAGELLLLDNCDRLDEAAQQALFALINRIQAGVPASLVLTGMQAPQHLQLREDLRNRVGWGLVMQLHLLDDAAKAQALEAHARERGIAIGRDLVPYLLAHHDRDIRSLSALFDALDRYAFEQKRPLSLRLLKDFEAQTESASGDRPAGC